MNTPNNLDKSLARYLMTNEQLYQEALGCLGPMDQKSHKEFLNEANKFDVNNPIIVIDIVFTEEVKNSQGMQDQPYQPYEDEWEDYIEDGRHMTEHMPKVYVVDGDQYSIPS